MTILTPGISLTFAKQKINQMTYSKLYHGCLVLLALFLISCNSVKILDNNKTLDEHYGNHFEPFKRSDYSILSESTGNAKSRQLYILIFPIGKSRSNQELQSNAYYSAVKNVPGADAVVLPRTSYKQFFIPLLLINYSSRSITVTGRAIKLVEKETILNQEK